MVQDLETNLSEAFRRASEIRAELLGRWVRKVEDVGDDFEAGEWNVVLAADPGEGRAFHVFELGTVLEENLEVALGVVEGVTSGKNGGGEVQSLGDFCRAL